MRVVLVSDWPIPSSVLGESTAKRWAPTPVMSLAHALSALGIDLHVITFSKVIDAPVMVSEAVGLTLHVLPASRKTGVAALFLPRVRQLQAYLDELAPDVVHGQGTEAGNAWLAVNARQPNVITLHGILRAIHSVDRSHRTTPEHALRWLESATLKRASEVIAISGFVRRTVEPIARGTRFHHVPNPVDDRFYETSSDGEQWKLVYVGRVHPMKGLADLLEAASLVEREDDAMVSVDVVGTAAGRGSDAYLEVCNRLSSRLSGSVRYLGLLGPDEVPSVIASASCLVLPSKMESFPMAAAEAMATGTPVIAYDVGGIRDLVEHNRNGLLVPPGDVPRLARAMHRVLASLETRALMGVAAGTRAQCWRATRVAAQTAGVYEKIVATA